ncbi:MAG: valine--tRNA ligase [Christensenellales bacterium]
MNMKKEMEKTYDPISAQNKLYEWWEKQGCFHDLPDPAKQPFSIVIPPPNITGQLHMGHALDNTMQDILARFKRMQGFCTLWLPGTDHASIATEVKIVEQMAKEGLTKEKIGREEFLHKAWEWKRQYGGRIVEQLKQLGASCDWQRERFTMDEGCNRAVVEVFIKLYEKGLIYRGSRIIHWCPDCRTALSDAEVEYEEQSSHLWHIRYPSKDGKDFIVVATTRPETMLGDTAVAVHPGDPRYSHLIGKTLILPIVGKEIPVVADEYVDKEFGTGAVKITPAHDPNDFEVALRHQLPVVRVLDDGGNINENGGKFCGMTREEARKAIVGELQAMGALVKTEAYTHNVGQCYRCGTNVEPIVSEQWFVKMKPLAQPAMEAVRNGDIEFVPKRFEKIYFNWMENIRDWCISRQLWWGHRIPAYYCAQCGQLTVSAQAPEQCSVCGCTSFNQDEDVLDTWFSSGLWPFSTMGWPQKTDDLNYFYPTSVLVTGYDIIFFWVARMIVFGLAFMGEAPFKKVLVHGIVRDSQGRKMSKSLGNGIDPLEVIQQHGADALRFSLVSGNSPGSDMRFYWEKVEACRNFANKIWNASRFVLMNIDDVPKPVDAARLDIADKWILHRLENAIREVTCQLEAFDFGLASTKLYEFVWNEFCDWYIEMAKERLYGANEAEKEAVKAVLWHILENTLKLLHPFMPYLSEEIYSAMDHEDSIMRAGWPKNGSYHFPQEEQQMQRVMEAVRAIRNIRAEMGVPPSQKAQVILVGENLKCFEDARNYMMRLSSAKEIILQSDKAGIPQNAVTVVCAGAEAYLPLEELIDIEKELVRLKKEQETLKKEIERAAGRLANEGFMNKAPQCVVDEERGKLEKYREMAQKVEERIILLGK